MTPTEQLALDQVMALRDGLEKLIELTLAAVPEYRQNRQLRDRLSLARAVIADADRFLRSRPTGR